MLASHAYGHVDETLLRERLIALRFDEREQFVSMMERILHSADVVSQTLTHDERRLRVKRKGSDDSKDGGSMARTRVEQLADEVEYKELDDLFGPGSLESEGDIAETIRESMTLIAWHATAPGSAPNANALLDSFLRAYPQPTRQRLAETTRVLQATAALILVMLADILDIEESGGS